MAACEGTLTLGRVHDSTKRLCCVVHVYRGANARSTRELLNSCGSIIRSGLLVAGLRLIYCSHCLDDESATLIMLTHDHVTPSRAYLV